ncbi:hypothetical protein Hypma_013916 [Hypsizygus marmoreus]|uniref:CENP-V/GFA domain-containing protein n=1 Tax=Hypsizygus marmoreus TaxID=39966 RepID=A0A369K615_HYPMA|nr:hypothetical protein Hypma_013916 [Hypsizygus marmoreus]
MSDEAVPMTSHGGCLCGKVRYTVCGEPKKRFICHCINCKRFSGSAFLDIAFFQPEQFTLESGKEYLKDYIDEETRSGNPLKCSFCSECGSSLTLSKDNDEMVLVNCGTFDGKIAWGITGEVFDDMRRAYLVPFRTGSE